MNFYHLTRRNIIHTVTGVIYEMAPGHMPRNIDKIVIYIKKWCDEHIGNKYLIRIKKEEVYPIFKEMLYNCEEFTQLNISQKLWDNGVRNYNDNRNSGFSVVAVGHDNNGVPCSILTPEEYSDFIDLGACIGNIVNEYMYNEETSEDCFLCKYSKEYKSMEPSDCKECKHCILNPNNKCNYETHPQALIPNNQKQNN